MDNEFMTEEDMNISEENSIDNEVLHEEVSTEEEVETTEETVENDDIGEESVSEPQNTVMKTVKNILSWIWTIALAFIIAIIINSYIIRASEVYGSSMNPTLEQGDVVFISRLPYILGDPKHNDIVVFDSTKQHRNFLVEVKESLKYNMISQKVFKIKNEEKYWIKRVIGIPGDVISAKDGILYRNGEPIEESYINQTSPANYNDFTEPVTVEDGYIFVMGDNRNASLDSRAIGQIPINDVLGRVVFGD